MHARPVLALVLAAACGGSSSSTPTAAPAPSPVAALCGNGAVEGQEECDDGNLADGDACLSTCQRPAAFVAGDPHLHTSGCSRGSGSLDDVARLAAAEGLRVGSVLVWGDTYAREAGGFTGRDLTAQPVLRHDLEVSGFPSGNDGHLLLLGLSSITFSPSPFRTPEANRPVLEWARAQGPQVLVGLAHGQFWPAGGTFPSPPQACCMPYMAAVHAARGQLQFLATEGLQDGVRSTGGTLDDGTFKLWKTIQNAGFRVPLAGSSDYPCIAHGFDALTPRTDVVLEGEVTYARWLDGVRAGRTSIVGGAGTHLNLRVNRAGLGSEVRVAAGDTVTVQAESTFVEPATVDVLANGAVVGSLAMPAGARTASLPVRLPASAWISLRSPRAATSPVYVLVDGRPIRGPAEDACYLIRYADHLHDLVESRRLDLGGDTATSLAAVAEARAEFARRFVESGGTACSN